MPKIILTVQSTGSDSYRLGISNDDSKQYFVQRKKLVTVQIGDITINTHTTCGPPLPKGFDLYTQELNSWILQNNFHVYLKGHPTKLEFDLSRNENRIILDFISRVYIKKQEL